MSRKPPKPLDGQMRLDQVRVEVDNRVCLVNAPPDARKLLVEAATIDNPAYERSKKEGIRAPKKISVAEVSGAQVSVPRGMLDRVLYGLEALGIVADVRDHRQTFAAPNGVAQHLSYSPRPYQLDAVRALVGNEHGILVAPPGSGKTNIALHAIESLRAPALILVDRMHLVDQWNDRAKSLGVTTICDVRTVQGFISMSDHARGVALDKYGIVVLDECHHLPAQIYRTVVDRSAARWRWGLSATPERQEGMLPITSAYLGPVVYEIGRETMMQNQFLVPAHIRAVHTLFSYNFHPTQKLPDGTVVKNNYSQMIAALIRDPARTQLIADVVRHEEGRGRQVLVVSRYIDHLRSIASRLSTQGSAVMTSKETLKKRNAIIDAFTRGEIRVLLTTLADEAIDLPSADVLVMACPSRNVALIEQQIGRVQRTYPGKTQAIVYDFIDYPQVLRAQFGNRLTSLYQNPGFTYEIGATI